MQIHPFHRVHEICDQWDLAILNDSILTRPPAPKLDGLYTVYFLKTEPCLLGVPPNSHVWAFVNFLNEIIPPTADDAMCHALLLTASVMSSRTYWSVKKYCLYYIFSMAWNTEFYPLNKSDISIGCYFDVVKISKVLSFS